MRNDDYSGAAVHVADAIASVLQADAAAGGDARPTATSPRCGTGQGLAGGGPIATSGLFATLLCMFVLVLILASSGARRRFPGRKTRLAAGGLTLASVASLVLAGSGAGWLVLVVGLILTSILWTSIQAHRCPKDGSWMTISEQIVEPPTYWNRGLAIVRQRCTNSACGFRRDDEKVLPRKQRTVIITGGGGGWGGGGGGGGGGFSGGGGGRSGGGGASGSV
jgi:uncharacterized membrane protein YgcG